MRARGLATRTHTNTNIRYPVKHTHTHTHTRARARARARTRTQARTHILILSLSLSLTHTHTQKHTLTHTKRARARARTHAITHHQHPQYPRNDHDARMPARLAPPPASNFTTAITIEGVPRTTPGNKCWVRVRGPQRASKGPQIARDWPATKHPVIGSLTEDRSPGTSCAPWLPCCSLLGRPRFIRCASAQVHVCACACGGGSRRCVHA